MDWLDYRYSYVEMKISRCLNFKNKSISLALIYVAEFYCWFKAKIACITKEYSHLSTGWYTGFIPQRAKKEYNPNLPFPNFFWECRSSSIPSRSTSPPKPNPEHVTERISKLKGDQQAVLLLYSLGLLCNGIPAAPCISQPLSRQYDIPN